MRQSLFVILIVTLLFGVSFWYGQTADICPAPIKYRVGEIDQRFNLSQIELRDVLFKSEAVWENATNRELFVYDENSNFTVNLIYDERQQLVHTEDEWQMSLDKQEKEGKMVMDKVKEMGKQYEVIKIEYQQQKDEYEKRLEEYNSQVEHFNQIGGAPKEQYEKLKEEQQELSGLLKDLLFAEKGLNELADEINSIGEQGNKLIDAYNENVKKYNEIFGNLEPFTQGDFQRERINIYKFQDKDELGRVMVHEFGHALGIAHVEGDKSIMYYLMSEQSDSTTLSDEDKKAVMMVCGEGEDFSSEVRRLIRNLLTIFN